MNRYLFSILLVMAVMSGSALAGPLDRMSVPRTNPAVDDMLRIPGVVGLSRQEALISLQQAGLNPALKIVRSPSRKHQGMEGKVIAQSPNPGGVAMIGATVSIELYLPPGFKEEAPAETWQNDPYQDQGGGYDDQWQDQGGGYDDQWQGVDPAAADQSGGDQNWGDTAEWPTEEGDMQWTDDGGQGPAESAGSFVPRPIRPQKMLPYKPQQNPSPPVQRIPRPQPLPIQP